MTAKANQNPEQIARDRIYQMQMDAGWLVQDKSKVNFSAGLGIVVREYQTDNGPSDYLLNPTLKTKKIKQYLLTLEGHKIYIDY
ncbi:MAG: hypothetical protein ACQETL_17850 [Bacteroidota bacterium]